MYARLGTIEEMEKLRDELELTLRDCGTTNVLFLRDIAGFSEFLISLPTFRGHTAHLSAESQMSRQPNNVGDLLSSSTAFISRE